MAHLAVLREVDLLEDEIALSGFQPAARPEVDLGAFDGAPKLNRLFFRTSAPVSAPKLCTFRNVAFAHVGDRFCILRGNGIDRRSTALPGPAMVRQMALGRPVRIADMAYFGGCHNPDNPAHYIVDHMARALLLKKSAGWAGKDIYFPQTSAPMNTALRNRLDPMFRQAPASRIYSIDRLTLFSDSFGAHILGHPFLYADPGLIGQIAAAAGDLAGQGHGNGARVYLSRASMGRRKLKNEAALKAALEDRGFVSVHPETLSGPDQLATMAEADIVVAPHGGALTGLIAARPGARVIELFHPERGTLAFTILAARRGLKYAPVFGTPADGDSWTIDVGTVLEALSDEV